MFTFKEVRAGLNDLTTRILGPNSLVQGALPEILETTPQSYFDNVMSILSENAEIVYARLKNLPGLTPRKPQGAMYLMVGLDLKSFPGMATDLDFVQALVREKSVFCLPAQVEQKKNFELNFCWFMFRLIFF
jgi:tyrosine aminotransferase